jgi:hypothetical protein
MATGSSEAPERRSELRANLLELVEACPFHRSNPEDCPLFPLRKMRPARRLQWFNALSQDDLDYLASYHHVCLNVQLESGLRRQRARSPGKG